MVTECSPPPHVTCHMSCVIFHVSPFKPFNPLNPLNKLITKMEESVTKRAKGQEGKRAKGKNGKSAKGHEGKRARGHKGKREKW